MSFSVKIKKSFLSFLFIASAGHAEMLITEVEVERLPDCSHQVVIDLPELNLIQCSQQGGVFNLSNAIDLQQNQFQYFKDSGLANKQDHSLIVSLPNSKITSTFSFNDNAFRLNHYQQTKFDIFDDLLTSVLPSEQENRMFRLKIKYEESQLGPDEKMNQEFLENIEEKLSLEEIK
jgi:hypothetical protein